MYKSLFVTFISLLTFSATLFANEEVVFNKVWTTNAKVTEQKLDNIAAVSGSGFKFVSQAATFFDSKTGNNVNGTLEYNNNGVEYVVSGQITGKFTTSGNTTALYFVSGSQYYVLVVPSYESSYLAADDPSYNSSGPDAALDALKTVQANHVIASMVDPSTVTESSSATYVTFSLVFSKSRTASGDNISFTPTITNTTTAAADFTGSIEYFNSSSQWVSATSGVTVAYNVNSVSLRIAVADDTRPEVNETFILNTGAFTGTGSSQVDNISGTYAVGTIADNNDPLIWTGASNTSWSTAANWNPTDLVPTANFNIIVPGSLTNYPIVASNDSVKSLEVRSSGGKVTISNSVTLSVTGTVTNNGQIIGQGELVLNGSSAQTMVGSGLYRNLRINNSNGVSITSGAGNGVDITGVLTLNLGTLTTNSNLTLKNTSSYAGIIGEVTCGSSTISGTITTERFIPGNRRAFRYLSPGVNTTTSIKSNWQEGVNNTATGLANNLNPNAKFGTHITGSKTGANGFDATLTGNSSLYTYNALTQNWIAAANTNTATLYFGKGYKILVRGSRATDMSTNTPVPDSTTLRTSGTPCLCTTVFNSSGTGTNVNPNVVLASSSNDFALVGNPYWSYVNWHTVTKSNVSNTYYIWDPNMRGSNDRGAFVPWIYNPSTNTGYTTAGTSAIDRYIQPGQAIFVQTTGASPSLTFNESDKLNTDNGRKGVFSTSPMVQDQISNPIVADQSNSISVLLYLKENLESQPADAVKIMYGNGWNDAIGVDDAVKLTNLDENLALLREGKMLAFEGRSLVKSSESDSLALKMWNLSPKTYTMRIDASQFSGPQQLYLVDRTSGVKTPIKSKSVVDVDFTPDASQKELSNYMLSMEAVQQSSVSTIAPIDGLTVYPNPVVELGNLKWDARLMTENTATIILTDLTGQKILTQKVAASIGSAQINLNKLPKGIYFVELSCGKKVFRKKIIKS